MKGYKDSMRVLILANFGLGLFKFRKELIERLVSEGYEVFVSFPKDAYVKKIESLGCNYIEYNYNRHSKNPFEDILLTINYIKIINKTKPDVVLTYTIKPNIYGGIAARIKNIPYITNITGLGSALENPGYLQSIILILYRIAMSKVHTIFFQNQENMDFFKSKNIAINKLDLLPGSGVNLQDYELQKYPDKSRLNFLFISRIMKEKGIEEYLQTAEYIKSKYPNTNFHICGFCEEDYLDIIELFEDRGIIEYHGLVEDVPRFLKEMHCTIHPTYYPEGMSNVLLESAASGRPIITTDRSGTREIVVDNVTGYIIEAKNSENLKKTVEKFIKLPHEYKKKMGEEGRKYVEKKFDRNIVVEKYMEKIKIIRKNKKEV